MAITDGKVSNNARAGADSGTCISFSGDVGKQDESIEASLKRYKKKTRKKNKQTNKE